MLFLASNPFEPTRLALDEEVRAITAQIQLAAHRDEFELISGWAVRPTTFYNCCFSTSPTLYISAATLLGTRETYASRQVPSHPVGT